MDSDHTTVKRLPEPTLSEIASALQQQNVNCPKCQGAGEREYETVRLTNLFDPYAYETGTCDVCHGDGEVTIEVCPLCRQAEAGCTCTATVCCHQQPINCDCECGVLFYQMAYGLPKRERLAA